MVNKQIDPSGGCLRKSTVIIFRDERDYYLLKSPKNDINSNDKLTRSKTNSKQIIVQCIETHIRYAHFLRFLKMKLPKWQ